MCRQIDTIAEYVNMSAYVFVFARNFICDARMGAPIIEILRAERGG